MLCPRFKLTVNYALKHWASKAVESRTSPWLQWKLWKSDARNPLEAWSGPRKTIKHVAIKKNCINLVYLSKCEQQLILLALVGNVLLNFQKEVEALEIPFQHRLFSQFEQHHCLKQPGIKYSDGNLCACKRWGEMGVLLDVARLKFPNSAKGIHLERFHKIHKLHMECLGLCGEWAAALQGKWEAVYEGATSREQRSPLTHSLILHWSQVRFQYPGLPFTQTSGAAGHMTAWW